MVFLLFFCVFAQVVSVHLTLLLYVVNIIHLNANINVKVTKRCAYDHLKCVQAAKCAGQTCFRNLLLLYFYAFALAVM